jgi:putative Holliday junction resolvase
MGRVAALDYGKARIGLALSDENKKIAFSKGTFFAKKNLEETASYISKELQALGSFETLLVGLPLFMNGKESPMSQEVRAFAKILQEKFGFSIVFYDERLTSALGAKLLDEAEVKTSRRKLLLDGLSASILLQNYLDTRESQKAEVGRQK